MLVMKKKRKKAEVQKKKEELKHLEKQLKIAAVIMVALNMFGFCLDLDFLLYLEIIPGIFIFVGVICSFVLDQE